MRRWDWWGDWILLEQDSQGPGDGEVEQIWKGASTTQLGSHHHSDLLWVSCSKTTSHSLQSPQKNIICRFVVLFWGLE